MNITGQPNQGLTPFRGQGQGGGAANDMTQQILPALLNKKSYGSVLDLDQPQNQPQRPWWYDLMNYGTLGTGPGNQGGAGLYIPPSGGFSGEDDDLLRLLGSF